MEYQDEDQEFLDYRSPKGQLIKLLEQKCKKPVIDESLGEILDKFMLLNNEQDKYLENGILNINFAEDALLLQGCATFYAKRVDKLWEELLTLHTGLVKCDQKIDKDDHSNSHKLEARQQELMKLEERLNRRRRKKVTLLEPENSNQAVTQSVLRLESMEMIDDFLSCEDSDIAVGEEPKRPFELDDQVLNTWRNMEMKRASTVEGNMSRLVQQFHRQTYRMKNYLRPPDDDDIIYDIDDPEEFYTRRSRIPSYDVIMHLFEYNDRCLVPDNKNATIAKLRLAFVEKKKYMIKNRITLETPFEQYKEHYEKFCADFFEKERKKIQNMPQNTKEEIQAFYRALEKKEEEAWTMKKKLKAMGIQSPYVNFDTVILDPLEREDGKTIWRVLLSEHGIEEEEQDPDMQELHSQEDFAIDLDQVNKTASDKGRSDSGYFESGFATDDEGDTCRDDTASEVLGDDETVEATEAQTQEGDKNKIDNLQDTMADSVLDTSLQSENGEIESLIDKESDLTGEINSEKPESNPNAECENTIENLNKEGNEPADKEESNISPESNNDPFDKTQEQNQINDEPSNIDSLGVVNTNCMSKSDQVNAQFEEFIKHHQYTQFPNGCIMIVYNKGTPETQKEIQTKKPKEKKSNLEKTIDGVAKGKIWQKDEENNEDRLNLKRKLTSADEVPIKRRKLSDKQVEKLKKSLIEPVNELKFESFFSLNYQSEIGEGQVTRVNYESDIEDDNDDTANDHNDTADDIEDHEFTRPESCRPNSCRPDSAIDLSGSALTTPVHMDAINEEFELNTTAADEAQPGCSSWPDEVDDPKLIEDMAAHAESMRQSQELSNKTKYDMERDKVRKSVAEWRAHIMPKLRQLDEHDFDIHQYGANIIDNFDKVNDQKSFKSMVDGKSSAEVVRFFISSLQLANTYNIEICGVQRGQLSNDSFELKLLNKERYHEHLEEYQAPSEEGLKEKMKKMKLIKKEEKKQLKKSKLEPELTPNKSKKSNKQANKQSEMTPLKVVLNRASVSTDDGFHDDSHSETSEVPSTSGYTPAQSPAHVTEFKTPSSRQSSFTMSPPTSTSSLRSKHSSSETSEGVSASKKIKIISCYSVQGGQRTKLDFNLNEQPSRAESSTSSSEVELNALLLNDDSLPELSLDELSFFEDLQSGSYLQSTPRR